MRRSPIIAIAASVLSLPAWSAPMKCQAAATPVERAICARPALVAADRRMSALYARRLRQCPDEGKAQLRLTQAYWLLDRDDCAGGDDAVARCAADRMAERTALLDEVGDECNAAAAAAAYGHVDVDYAAANAQAYDGKAISLVGIMRMTSCDPQSSDLTATLASAPGKPGLPVYFKEMSAARRASLCAGQPPSTWSGTVRYEHGVTYLFLK